MSPAVQTLEEPFVEGEESENAFSRCIQEHAGEETWKDTQIVCYEPSEPRV